MKYLPQNFQPSQSEAYFLEQIGLQRIPFAIPFPLPPVNITIVEGKDSLALIDTGMSFQDNWEILKPTLASRGWNLSDIQEIYLTHPHLDHYGMLPTFLSNTDATVFCWKPAQQRFEQGLSFWKADYHCFLKTASQHHLEHEIQSVTSDYIEQVKPFSIFSFFPISETFEMVGRKVKAFHCAGHSPWCIAFWLEEEKVLVGGDVLLEKITSNPIWYPEEAAPKEWQGLQVYQRSLRFLETLPIQRVLPGHGFSFQNATESIQKALQNQKKRKQDVLRAIEQLKEASLLELGLLLFGEIKFKKAFFLVVSELLRNIEWLEEEKTIQIFLKKDTLRYRIHR